ncbi:MAG TPA: hypothetical protein VF235_09105 [Actinomycetota bacterium]
MTEELKEQIDGWFAGRLPQEWFDQAPDVTYDRDEILVVGTLPEPDLGVDASEEARASAVAARIQGFREDTRGHRMRIADEAERRFGRKVSWGVTCGAERQLFTVLAIPAMTRLRLDDRKVLDTLVEAGVARSRSHALAWCVRLVGRNQDEWLAELREALKRVEDVRGQGPDA